MADIEQNRYWMQRAIDLAARGVGLCSPNPVVGCVILDRSGQVRGEGWHEYDRRDHAEAVALREAGEGARGGTAYITLEPCNHAGRTPPCTDALIRAGLKRVVAAVADPNPRVAGGGMETLRAAGIETEIGVCRNDAARLNEGFARWSQSRRPFVLMKVAMSLDGRIAPPGPRRPREPYWITGEAAREAVQQLRWQADAIVTGIGTVLADDPLLTDRSGKPRRRPLLRVVLDSALRIPLDSRLVQTARNDVLIFTVSGDAAGTRGRIQELAARGVRVETVDGEDGRVSLKAVLACLASQDILTVLTETGTELNTAFLDGGLVDRMQFFIAPAILGSGAAPAFDALTAPIRSGGHAVEWYGEDFGISYLLQDPWLQGKNPG